MPSGSSNLGIPQGISTVKMGSFRNQHAGSVAGIGGGLLRGDTAWIIARIPLPSGWEVLQRVT